MAAVETRRRRDLGEKQVTAPDGRARTRVELAPRGGNEYVARPLRLVPQEVIVVHAPARRHQPSRDRPKQAPRREWSAERRRRFRHRFLPALGTLLAAPSVGAYAALDRPTPSIGTAQASGARLLTPPAGRLAPATARGGGAVLTHVRTGWPLPRWHATQSLGLPWSGHLQNGVQLPSDGADFTTWDPVYNRVPNRDFRRYGSRKLVRLILRVAADYRAAHPGAPRLVIGDLSRIGGGPLDDHVSHQNGLDVDIYYPRRDSREAEPTHIGQIDLVLAQDLVSRFVAAGAQFVFIGPSTPFHGPSGTVEPLAEHDNHMHVRIFS